MNSTIQIYELPCYDNRKSFYGKAHVKVQNDGSAILQSYNTDVCQIDANGTVTRLWGGYSATTMRHVNSFLEHFGVSGKGKAFWDALPIS